jgi:hypothetical protein
MPPLENRSTGMTTPSSRRRLLAGGPYRKLRCGATAASASASVNAPA